MYSKILLPIDLGNESSWVKALPVAVDYCAAFGAGLDVLTVVPEFGLPMVSDYFPEDHEKRMREHTADLLARFVADRVPDTVDVRRIVESGTIYKAIIETADRTGADLIVMSAHRPELQDYLLGPNAARVVRHSSKSVLVVR